MNLQILNGKICETPSFTVCQAKGAILRFKIIVETRLEKETIEEQFECELRGIRAEYMIKSAQIGNFVYVRGRARTETKIKGNYHKETNYYTEVEDVQWFPYQKQQNQKVWRNGRCENEN